MVQGHVPAGPLLQASAGKGFVLWVMRNELNGLLFKRKRFRARSHVNKVPKTEIG